jgi:excinuclease ABC subunit C
MPINETIRKKLSKLPHKPGVYLMKDRFGTVIYIGKAKSLRKRVSQYFHPSRRQRWDMKFNALVEAIQDFDVHQVKSDPDAVLLEGKLIKEFKPRYNISFKDDKRFLLLKVNLKDSIPRFTLTRMRQDDGSQYFGPFASSGAIRRTMTLVRQKFNLRGCRPLTPNEHDYKHCLYGHLKHCTAPCIGNISKEDYLKQVEAACEFLTGQSSEMETELESMMRKAAETQDFEKAAELRDMLQDLKKATQKTGKFSRLPYKLPLAIDPIADMTELRKVLGLIELPVRIEGFDISNISGTFKVASMVRFKNGRPDRSNYRRYKMKTVKGQDDFACMAETVRRRYSRLKKEYEEQQQNQDDDHTIKPPYPELILIDGGKGQLGMACDELDKLGLSHIPIIGLAKEFEEIYRPGESDPIRLDHRSGALKLLQRVRDESHRFANTFNAQLRLKKISESLLDEFPGIGQHRKAALLKKFGSVQRLKTATLEEIAIVPGFGGKTAEKLKAFLAAR